MFNREERNSVAESALESYNKVINIPLWEGALKICFLSQHLVETREETAPTNITLKRNFVSVMHPWEANPNINI